jgi:uncharacterized phage protein gp47/JayE
MWPIPRARSIFDRIAAALEAGILLIRPDGDPVKLSMAVRGAQGVFSQIIRAIAPEIRELHDHQAWWGRQYMPDSADDEAMIRRHASIWGVDGRGALTAVGSVLVEGIPGKTLPAGIALAASSGQQYATTIPAVIAGNGSVIIPAIASTAGASGNLAAGVQLGLVSGGVAGISKISVSSAFEGGADEMTPDELKTAYMRRIRQPPHGGAVSDYLPWVQEVADVLAVKVIPDWIGRGSVGVAVVMKDDDGSARAPTAEELERIQTHLGDLSSSVGVKPVTARVIVLAGELTAVPLALRLRPDAALTRVAVAEAFRRFILTIGDDDDSQNDSPIGAIIEPSRISEALSAAEGEYAHDLINPSAKYTLGPLQYPVPGSITWVLS